MHCDHIPYKCTKECNDKRPASPEKSQAIPDYKKKRKSSAVVIQQLPRAQAKSYAKEKKVANINSFSLIERVFPS